MDYECQTCYEVFYPKRIDQKYCSRKCRIRFYNKRYQEAIKPYMKIVLQLKHYDEILERLFLPEKPNTTFKKSQLVKYGISFVNAKKIIKKTISHSCYEYLNYGLEAISATDFKIYSLSAQKTFKSIQLD